MESKIRDVTKGYWNLTITKTKYGDGDYKPEVRNKGIE